MHIGRLPTVLGDRAQLRAVLQNLLGNAAKYRSDERPLEVHIAARHVQRAWRIEVTDNGRGVPPADRNRVFEPLARADDSVEGSGIGLATCRRIVGAHGGRIGIDPGVVEGVAVLVRAAGLSAPGRDLPLGWFGLRPQRQMQGIPSSPLPPLRRSTPP